MAVASCIPSFKAALEARLAAAVDSATTVSYGVDLSSGGEKDLVVVGGAKGEDPTGRFSGGQSTAAMGRKRREERWVQDIVVSCVRSSRETQQTVTERAFAIVAVIEDSLRTWLTATPAFSGYTPPTGADFHHALVVATDLEEVLTKEEREARVTVRVACAARI